MTTQCENLIEQYLKLIDKQWKSVVEGVRSPALKEPIGSLLVSGKRVRPLLTLLACEAGGGKAEDAVPAALSVELLHTASLIHDDMMDASSKRRGKPTIHTAYGNKVALLCGDFLVSLAYEEIYKLPEAVKVKVWNLMNQTYRQLCEGQALEEYINEKGDVSSQDLLEVIEKKTAVLIDFATSSGAVVSGVDLKTVNCFSEFGKNIGYAFQIKDDILDIIGDEEEMGKDCSQDEKNKKVTWMESIRLDDRSNASVEDKINYAEQKVKEFTNKALEYLSETPQSEKREVLKEFTLSLLDRRS